MARLFRNYFEKGFYLSQGKSLMGCCVCGWLLCGGGAGHHSKHHSPEPEQLRP